MFYAPVITPIEAGCVLKQGDVIYKKFTSAVN